MDADTIAALERHREAQIAEKDKAGDAYTDRDLIFADGIGRPINPQRVTDWFGGHRKTAGIRPGRFHDVRHSHATHLLTEGVPVHRLGSAWACLADHLERVRACPPRSDERAAEVLAEVLG